MSKVKVDGLYHVFGIGEGLERAYPGDPTMRKTVFTQREAEGLRSEWEEAGFVVQIYGKHGVTDILRNVVEAFEASDVPDDLWNHFYASVFDAHSEWLKYLETRAS